MSGLHDVGTSSGTVAEATVPIMLTTSLDQYAIPPGPYMVPVSWRRTHLSTLVNKLVASASDTSPSVPFDFIIDANLLRSSLGEFLDSNAQTAESTLAIEYVRSTLPPTRLAAFEHDDWVASVQCSANTYMTASYDASVRIFTPNDPVHAAHTFSTINKSTVQGGRNTALTHAKWTPAGAHIVTAGMDGCVQMWSVEQAETWRSARVWAGTAHNAPVSAIDVAQGPAGVSVLSVGWDGLVALWDDVPSTTLDNDNDDNDDDDDESDEVGGKRRKTGAGASVRATKPRGAGGKEATMVMWHAAPAAHAVTGAKHVYGSASRVAAVLFEGTAQQGKDSNRAWTAGSNGLKGWDLGSGGTMHTALSLPSSTAETRPITALAQLSASALVAGASDRAMQIFDVRSSTAAAGTGALGIGIANAHRGAVDALAAHPIDTNLFASASSADAVVKVWDTRSSKKALFSLGVADKSLGILALDWSADGQQLVAGGKDKRITVFRGANIGMA